MSTMICTKHSKLNCSECLPSASKITATTGAESSTQLTAKTTDVPSSTTTNTSQTVTTVAPSSATGSSVAPNIDGVPVNASSTEGSFAEMYALFPSATTNTTALVPANNGPAVKRKRGPVKGSKRVKKTIVDDEVACAIFLELRVGNPFLNSGKLLAWALQPEDEAFLTIHDYVACSQEHGFGVEIKSILRVIPGANKLYEGEASLEQQLDFNEDPNTKGKLRMMLWHGTSRLNLKSILEGGLRVPRLRSQMFGSGIYFADRVSKSCQYTDHGIYYDGHVSYLLLCDVLLGDIHKSYKALPHTTAPPNGKNSIRGVGQRIPDSKGHKDIDGCIWPLGPTIDNKEENRANLPLRYNEYIVYDTNQVQPKYLLKVEYTQEPYYEKLR